MALPRPYSNSIGPFLSPSRRSSTRYKSARFTTASSRERRASMTNFAPRPPGMPMRSVPVTLRLPLYDPGYQEPGLLHSFNIYASHSENIRERRQKGKPLRNNTEPFRLSWRVPPLHVLSAQGLCTAIQLVLSSALEGGTAGEMTGFTYIPCS